MFKKILVPTDGSPLSDKAADAAIEFAKLVGGNIVTIGVAEPAPYVALSEGGAIPGDLDAYQHKASDVARHHVDKVCAAASAAAVPCETVTTFSATPYVDIVDTAQQHNCDIIFIASHGRKGLQRLFLGSQTQKVLAHTTLPVLVFR